MDHHQWTNTEAEWEREKAQVLDSLVGPNQEVVDVQIPLGSEVKSVNGGGQIECCCYVALCVCVFLSR